MKQIARDAAMVANFLSRTQRLARVCALTALSVFIASNVFAANNPKFLFEIGGNESTVGDIKPAFIDFSADPVPSIPIREIIRRYKQLFDTTSDPVIRIDALWRLNALEQKFGTEKDISPEDEMKLYRRALESYQALIVMPSPPYPLEQLLYQAAKAYDLTGAQEESIASLERLAKRFPTSELAAESWFRIGENHFANARYDKADIAYQNSVKRGTATRFYDKALFMSGWARFKQDKRDPALESFNALLEVAYERDKSLERLSRLEQETINDSLRAMSMIFSYGDNRDATAKVLHRYKKKPYIHHLYSHLSKFYLEQERYEDSASVNREFVDQFADSEWAPVFAARNIETYKLAKFSSKLIAEKRSFVDRYAGKDSKVSSYSPEAREKLLPYLGEYLDDLSHLDYVAAQSEKNAAQQNALYERAAGYYETYAQLMPADKETGMKLFLAGESYYNAALYSSAVPVYLKSAYQNPVHAKSRDAAYGAIIAFQKSADGLRVSRYKDETISNAGPINSNQAGQSPSRSIPDAAVQQELKLSLQFADAFPDDTQAPLLLANAASLQYKVGNYIQSTDTASRVVAHKKASKELKKSAYLLLGNAYFDQSNFPLAEENFKKALPLFTNAESELRRNVESKLSASIYRQAEVASAAGDWELAVATFIRLTHETPNSEFKVNALYDASAELLRRQQWQRAIPLLVEFKQEFPGHSLTAEVSDKLVIAYLEAGDLLFAADELLTLATTQPNSEKGREALYQSAELFAKAGRTDQSINLYKRYQKQYPKPVAYSVEATKIIADYNLARGNGNGHIEALQKLIEIDRTAGSERSERTVYLAAEASLWFAEQQKHEFDRIKLTLPLKTSMVKKRSALTATIASYQAVAEYGVSDFKTQATCRLAEIYGQLSRDLLASDVPNGLDELQLEQYTILLEEQAYPFEEKSIELHEMNIINTRDGIYDTWVQKSYLELAKIFPARYSRSLSVIEYADKAY